MRIAWDGICMRRTREDTRKMLELSFKDKGPTKPVYKPNYGLNEISIMLYAKHSCYKKYTHQHFKVPNLTSYGVSFVCLFLYRLPL